MNNVCREHRKYMVLLGLQKQLKNSKLEPEKEKELKKMIQALEKELEID